MIIETSALVSILFRDASSERLIRAISVADRRWLSVANYVETAVVIHRRLGPSRVAGLDRLCAALDITDKSVTPRMGHLAATAHLRFGQGSGHPARLNYGDCFAYALAVDTGQPLLFVGDDFTHTDVTAAPW